MPSDEEDEEMEIRLSKERFESPARKIHQDITRRKKKSQSNHDDSIDHSDQSSEWSHQDENERANQMAGHKKGRLAYDRQGHQMRTFHPQMGQSQKSDGELYNTGSLRRYENMHNLPTSVSGLVSPIDERKDFLSHQHDHHLTEAIISKEQEALKDQVNQETKAFENKIYGSRTSPGGVKAYQKGGEYIYVNDVPPSYASHSEYPVHVDSDPHSHKLGPSYISKDFYPPSPSMSSKDASYLSDSGQSASIADSSDVFEESTAHPMFHDTDSDVEIPPIDMDDFPSSYMPESLRLQQKLAESPRKPKKPTLVVIPRSKEQPSSTTPKLVTFQQPDSSPQRSVPGSQGHLPSSNSGPDPIFKKPPIPPPPHNSGPIPGYQRNASTTQNGSQSSGAGNAGSATLRK